MTNGKDREPYTFPYVPEERNEHHVEHEHLLSIVKTLPTDFEPWGQRPNSDRGNGGDCSCGCVFYEMLEGPLGSDWGVCANPASPRVGLLTFEHQGCPQFQYDPAFDEDNDGEFPPFSLARYLKAAGQTELYRCPKCGDTLETIRGGNPDQRCHNKHGRKPFTQMERVENTQPTATVSALSQTVE